MGRPVGDLHTVGDGASALRFNFGPGYRVCSAQKSDSLMLLLYKSLDRNVNPSFHTIMKGSCTLSAAG